MLEVEFWNGDEWVLSYRTSQYDSIEDLVRSVGDNNTVCLRARSSPADDWQFVETACRPHRYTNSNSGGGGLYFAELPQESCLYPITDLLTREAISTPPAISLERIIMPAPAAPPAPTTPNSLADLKIARDEGKLVLALNAKPLHDLLDSIGCRAEGNMYADMPSVGFSAIQGNKLSTTLFLRREYPVRLALSQYYSRPASFKELKELCESGHAAVETILQHYQPVDISYSIQKMVK